MYPYFYAACSFLAWMPVFFLYFSSILGLKEVLQLEAIYYIAVVLLEVPTGYYSDVVGRKKTLVLGAFFLCLAAFFYIWGGSFWILMIGQLAFALHMSLISGTNTVFHYESLLNEGRASSYGDREAIVNKYGMIAGGTAALLGGAVATMGLHFAYVITLVSGVAALLIALKFEEPSLQQEDQKAVTNMIGQFKTTASYLKSRPLGWLFCFYIVMFAVSHVPYEFYQPYIQILADRQMLFGVSVPIVAGLLYAGARYMGAFGAAYSMVWARKFGLGTFLMLCLLVMNLIVLIMGATIHSAIILIVLFRSLPWAAVKAPINAIVTPAIEAGQRATFHSMISLACRLAFFITLMSLSFVVAKEEAADWENLQFLLRICFVSGLLLMMPIWWKMKSNLNESLN